MKAHPVLAALSLTLGLLVLGCEAMDDDSSPVLDVDALSGPVQLTAGSVQRFVASGQGTSDQVEHHWRVDASEESDYGFEAQGTDASFVARTAGTYRITLARCGVDRCSSVQVSLVATLPEGEPSGSDEDGFVDDDSEDSESGLSTPAAGACTPNCIGKVCGPDGCGGNCGECLAGQTCEEGVCKTCPSSCIGRECGIDPACGVSCGDCDEGNACNQDGQCVPENKGGRVVTIVMGLTDHNLASSDPRGLTRARLVEQSVRWVSPVTTPKVLVMLDDTCQGPCRDAAWIGNVLRAKRLPVEVRKEPAGGMATFHGFDVVWFTNPNRPVDDEKTVQALKAFAQNGGGVVLSGDDITRNPHLETLTRLHAVSDGAYHCGHRMDGGWFGSYEVRTASASHPVTHGLQGTRLYYGADIDSSTLIPGGRSIVLAWAQLPRHRVFSCQSGRCAPHPAVVAFDMRTP